jgi:hypothetical protein
MKVAIQPRPVKLRPEASAATLAANELKHSACTDLGPVTSASLRNAVTPRETVALERVASRRAEGATRRAAPPFDNSDAWARTPRIPWHFPSGNVATGGCLLSSQEPALPGAHPQQVPENEDTRPNTSASRRSGETPGFTRGRKDRTRPPRLSVRFFYIDRQDRVDLDCPPKHSYR